MKNKKNLIIIGLVIAISLIGITYAFFDYYKIGSNQKVTAGKVNLVFNEGEDTINISNIFPTTAEKARSRDDNFITFTVSGINTTEDQDIYYEIMLNEGDAENGMTRFKPEDLVFDLIELNNDGSEGTYLIDALSYADLNARRIWVNTVDRNTANEVNKTYKLRMWLSEYVLISDTDPAADYPATGYKNHYASVKVSVYGDFIEKQLPYNYMTRIGVVDTQTGTISYWSDEIEAEKANITEVNFVTMEQDVMKQRYTNATIKEDMTDSSKSKEGSVLAWLEINSDDNTKYTMYVASDGITFFPSDSSGMLGAFGSLTEVNFENINTRDVTNMMMMFGLSTSLSHVDVSNFDTSQVNVMNSMFYNCSSLTSLDVSKWDTSQVTSMRTMFYNCSSLTSLDVSRWDTSQVTNMTGMFAGKSIEMQLASLDVSRWDTSQVTSMRTMFQNCSSLESLDVSNWNTSQVTDMSYMFNNCSGLTYLDVSNWNTSQVTDMSYMFNYCSGLIYLDASKWDTSKITTMERMFSKCDNLTTIYANSDWNTDNVTTSTYMFTNSSKLVGGVSYSSSNANDITFANPTTGYFTKKTV